MEFVTYKQYYSINFEKYFYYTTVISTYKEEKFGKIGLSN